MIKPTEPATGSFSGCMATKNPSSTGDSMEPVYTDKQKVFVHAQDYLNNGEIGIFSLDDNVYIKKLQDDDNGHFLISLNKKYDPIPINENSNFMVLGKVL